MITIRLPPYEGGSIATQIDADFEARLLKCLAVAYPGKDFSVSWEDGVVAVVGAGAGGDEIYRLVCDLWVEFLMSTVGEDEVQTGND